MPVVVYILETGESLSENGRGGAGLDGLGMI